MKSLFYLLTAGFVLALPTELEQRSCSSLAEPQLWTISSHVPEVSDGPFTSPFRVFQDIGKKDLIASFRYIPGDAYGCSLQFIYNPQNSPLVVDSSGDTTLIDVYQISDGGNFPYPLTWDNTEPRTGALIGSFRFPSGADASQPQTIWINSFVCSPIMTFRLTIEDPQANGGVQMNEDANSGLTIVYNC